MADNSNASSRANRTTSPEFASPLYLHRATIVLLYVASAAIASVVLALPEALKDLIALLSAGAIFATFGSAVSAVGSVWERDLLERVRVNVDVLYKDILHQENPWRRWPFLARAGKRRLLDGSTINSTLSNPEVPLNVGTHLLKVDLPTVLEDFFDLPLIQNYSKLARFRSSASTTFANREKGAVSAVTGMVPGDEFMAYECMHDIWRSILCFRLARYATHFGTGLTLAGTAFTVWHVAARGV